MEESGYLRTLFHTEANEGENTELGGEGARMRKSDLFAIEEECVELIDERRIEFEKGLVEAMHEGGVLLS